MLRDLILKNRSIRRFQENTHIELNILHELVDLARMSASGANKQPLKYLCSNTRETNDIIFPSLGWAGYLKDWKGPAEGERPAAYIVICNDTTIKPNPGVDHGIAAQSILLGAAERGIGGCMIGNVAALTVKKNLGLEDHLEIVLVIALGIPSEEVVLEDIGDDNDIRYYRDEKDVHHVPKRALKDILL